MGPYLQELTNTGVTFVFTTSEKGISWVELKDNNGKITSHYDVKNGLRNAYTTFNTIRVEGLHPDTRYQYRMISKQITDFQPYKVTFGDSITSQWYEFSTWNPKTDRCSFIALSDMHQDHDKLAQLLNLADVQSADIIFYVGDMMNYYDNEAVPFQSFIDTSVSLFATERPFVLVRGNHETRGNKARELQPLRPEKRRQILRGLPHRRCDVRHHGLRRGQAGRLLGLCGFDRFRRLPQGAGRVVQQNHPDERV